MLELVMNCLKIQFFSHWGRLLPTLLYPHNEVFNAGFVKPKMWGEIHVQTVESTTSKKGQFWPESTSKGFWRVATLLQRDGQERVTTTSMQSACTSWFFDSYANNNASRRKEKRSVVFRKKKKTPSL
jgi:hypothetical protein